MERVLIVDDEEPIRRLLGEFLKIKGYECAMAAGGREAREDLERGKFDLILCDLNMPGESGLDLLQDVFAKYPDMAGIVVSAVGDPEVAKKALEIGVYGYLVKPFQPNELYINVTNALRRRQLEIESRAYREDLEQKISLRTAELQKTLQSYRSAIEGIIQAMSRTVEMRDPYTAGHQRRVAGLAGELATAMGLSQDQIEGIQMAGVIHDVGKIAIPAEILSKPGRITGLEYSLIKAHPQIGFDIIKDIDFPWPVAEIVLQHHERMDGSGYPLGLPDEDILLESRILAVADVVEAMASHRPYRPGFGIEKALEHVIENAGGAYDTDVIGACTTVFRRKGYQL